MAADEIMGRNVQGGQVLRASAWMLGLGIALKWLPVIGPFIAGFVGGKKAGAPLPAAVAVFLPGLIITTLSFILGGILGGLPIVGPIFAAIFGLAGSIVALLDIGPLLIGALIGGWRAKA